MSSPEQATTSTATVTTRSRIRRPASQPASRPLTTRAPSTQVASATGISTTAEIRASGLTDQPTSMSSRARVVPMPPIVVIPATTSPGSRERAVTGSSANRSGASVSSALTTIDPIHHTSTIADPTTTSVRTAASGAAMRRATSPAARAASSPSATIADTMTETISHGLRPN